MNIDSQMDDKTKQKYIYIYIFIYIFEIMAAFQTLYFGILLSLVSTHFRIITVILRNILIFPLCAVLTSIKAH